MDEKESTLLDVDEINANNIDADEKLITNYQIMATFDKYKKVGKRKILFHLLICLILTVAVVILIQTLSPKKNSHSDNKNIENCDYYHPQYPFSGGGACAQSCADGYYSPSLDYTIARNNSHAFSPSFLQNMHSAGQILNSTNNPYIKPMMIDEYQGRALIHMTVDYFCCYNHSEIEIIDNIISNYIWPPVEVRFEKLNCTLNGNFRDGFKENELVEFMVIVDQESQNKLFPLVKEFENEMKKHGLTVNVPRSENVGFHVTLGFVNGLIFPVQSIMKQINDEIVWNETSFTIWNSTICFGGEFPPNSNNYYKCIG